MRWFARRSTRDREHLVQTLRSLGSTSVAGLAAALSWSERKTERTIQDAVGVGVGAIRFDPSRRTVAWDAPAAPIVPEPAAPVADVPPPEVAPTALPKSWGASARCPACQVTYLPTGTGNHLYCPQCGRLAGARGAAGRATETGAPVALGRASAPATNASATTLGPDRRSQELFAAWVTAQPIPCPKCRTPLRHHGVAEYACPSCGARVAFERSAGVPAPSPASAAPAAPTPSAPMAPAAR